jgi:hypothetical protein
MFYLRWEKDNDKLKSLKLPKVFLKLLKNKLEDLADLENFDEEDIENFMSELGSRKNLNLKQYAKEMKDFISLNIDTSWPKVKKKKWMTYLNETIKKEHDSLNAK